MAGWITCGCPSFSAVFQSYQDNGRMIMKGSVQWNPFTVEKNSPRARLEFETSRSLGERLTHRATGVLSTLGLSEPKKAEFLGIFILISIF